MKTGSRSGRQGDLIALFIGIGGSFLSLEVLARLIPASAYFPVQSPIECEDLNRPNIKCFVRRFPNQKGRYTRGVLPPLQLMLIRKQMILVNLVI